MTRDGNAFSIALEDQLLLLRLPELDPYAENRWDTERHCNGEFELHILLRGTCWVEVEEQNILLGEGQALLIAPGKYHRPRASGELLRFSASFSVAEGALAEALRARIASSCCFPLDRQLEQVCQAIRHETASVNFCRREMLQAQVTQLMVLMLRRLKLTLEPRERSPVAAERSRAELIDGFFEQHFADRAGKQALAQQLHLSQRQLARVLWEIYGMGFRQKQICARMDHAAWLLRTTDKQVGEIAGIVGYGSEAAFYQVFRKQFQCTPQQYRGRFRKEEETWIEL